MKALMLVLVLNTATIEPTRDYTVTEARDTSCGAVVGYLESMEEESEGLEEAVQRLMNVVVATGVLSWSFGYVTAIGQRVALAETDERSIYLYLQNYCEENPLANLQDAVNSLVAELADRAASR